MGKTPRQKLVDKLDKIFSEYVRLFCCDEYGYGRCITCYERKFYKEADCGHFITRAKKSTRWLHQPPLVNASLQCKQCNMNGGQQYIHGRVLDAKYGDGTADEILRLSNIPAKYSQPELQEMVDNYKVKLTNLKATKYL
tara:strand:- start:11221 stop:11637 length:417 start_codon:yes stop_codon:yes gene_type:complete